MDFEQMKKRVSDATAEIEKQVEESRQREADEGKLYLSPKTCFGAIATKGEKRGKLVVVISFVDDPDGMKEALLEFFRDAIKHKLKVVLLTDEEARSGWGKNPDQPKLI